MKDCRLKERIKKYWLWGVATLVFLVFLLFKSDLTLVGLIKTQTSVKRLRSEIERYQEQIAADSIFMERLKDDEFLEKYAREKHLMHSKDEQLFIIE